MMKVCYAMILGAAGATVGDETGCKVTARRTAAVGQKQTWQIFHMVGAIPPIAANNSLGGRADLPAARAAAIPRQKSLELISRLWVWPFAL